MMMGAAAARVVVLADTSRYKAANGLPAGPDLNWDTFSDHAPFKHDSLQQEGRGLLLREAVYTAREA